MDQSSCLVVSSPKTLSGCLDRKAEGSQGHVANVISPRLLNPHLVLPTQIIQRFLPGMRRRRKTRRKESMFLRGRMNVLYALAKLVGNGFLLV